MERTNYGYATVTPLYGDFQDPQTVKIDIKWALENGVTTFVMPTAVSNSPPEQRIDELFLPASEPPFDINFSLMFNAAPSSGSSDSLAAATIDCAQNFIAAHLQHPRYKRLPDGRPVVFYYSAQTTAWNLGVDALAESVALLRSNVGEKIFLVGDVIIEPYGMRTSPQYANEDFVAGQVKPFDAITCYYMWHAGYEWKSLEDYNHVVTPFKDMITGYQEALDVWAAKAHQYGAKLVPPISPAGVSNRLTWEAGLDAFLSDRHEGVSYDTAKQMAELGAKYADPDLKMTVVGAWNECTEGAAIVPSKGFKFGPAHAVRDTFGELTASGWPEDFYPSGFYPPM